MKDGLFLEAVRHVHQEFPDVQLDDLLVDASTARTVKEPERFVVIGATNLYGDILSDLASDLSGGLGLDGSIMAGDAICCARAQHGSAPSIAGKDVANPTSMILFRSLHALAGGTIGALQPRRISAPGMTQCLYGVEGMCDPSHIAYVGHRRGPDPREDTALRGRSLATSARSPAKPSRSCCRKTAASVVVSSSRSDGCDPPGPGDVPTTGLQRLNMVQIDPHQTARSFSELRDHILQGLRYPTDQDQKIETFGYTLSSFRPSERVIKRKDGSTFTRHGLWRSGHAEEDGLSAFYADVDNANIDQPIITPQKVEERLRQLGLSYFIYTSFSHTVDKPKFRVIIDTDRAVLRSELLRLAVYLGWHVFGFQADFSIYDPGDFLFAPPHRCETFEMLDGRSMNVAQVLVELDGLQKTSPACWSRVIEQRQPTQRTQRNDAGQARSEFQLGDLSVRPDVGLDNPSIFNPAWESLYQDHVSGGHWETMRSLLGMVWVKTGGSLSYGEMRHLLTQIDATADGYLLRYHGEQKADEIIKFIMSRAVEPIEDDRCSLLEMDEVDLTIYVKEGGVRPRQDP